MLGVQRTTINLVERTLQHAGLIQVGRGRISILDIESLHAVACDCYDRIPDSSGDCRPAGPLRQKRSSRCSMQLARDLSCLLSRTRSLLRMDAIDAIEKGGFQAVDAKNADDAIAILEQRNDVILIFTDIDMPGSMDGLKLAHFVKNRWPPIKIIATSGYAKVKANDLPEGSRFIPKPYKAPEVAETIHQLIQSREMRHPR